MSSLEEIQISLIEQIEQELKTFEVKVLKAILKHDCATLYTLFQDKLENQKKTYDTLMESWEQSTQHLQEQIQELLEKKIQKPEIDYYSGTNCKNEDYDYNGDTDYDEQNEEEQDQASVGYFRKDSDNEESSK